MLLASAGKVTVSFHAAKSASQEYRGNFSEPGNLYHAAQFRTFVQRTNPLNCVQTIESSVAAHLLVDCWRGAEFSVVASVLQIYFGLLRCVR